MITAYILILAFSAWLVTRGLVLVAARLVTVVQQSLPLQPASIAFVVSLAFLVVAAAPAWVLLLAIAAAFLARSHSVLCVNSPFAWHGVLLALIPLIAAPLLGAPSWLAVDVALVAAALLGAIPSRGDLSPMGAAFPAFLTLILGLAAEALLVGGPHAP